MLRSELLLAMISDLVAGRRVSVSLRLVCVYSRVESSLELLNAPVRVESRVAGLDVKSSRKSSQYTMNN